MPKLRKLGIFYCFFLFTLSSYAQDLLPPGLNDFKLTIGGVSHPPAMIQDGNGVLYTAYRDGVTGKATVKKLDGTNWVDVGAGAVSAGAANFIAIALNAVGTPYLAYRDEVTGSGNKAIVRKFDGTAWVDVGPAGVSAGGARYTSIALDGAGTLYLAYRDETTGGANKAVVRKFDGTAWVDVGPAGAVSAGAAGFTSIALDKAGTPYLAYRDEATGSGSKAIVRKFTGTTWENVGAAAVSAGAGNFPALAIDAHGSPFLAFIDGANSSKVAVKKFNGTAWDNVGPAGISSGRANYTAIAIGRNGAPYVSYQDMAYNSIITIKTFTGTTWANVSPPAPLANIGTYTALAIDRKKIYTAYFNGGVLAKAFDINAAPTDVALTAASIDENVVAGSEVGAFISTDPDKNIGDTHAYALVSGGGDTDNAAFSIAGSALTINGAPDFEVKPSYRIRVRTQDAHGLFFEKALTITIRDLDEVPPQVSGVSPGGYYNTDQTITFNEGTATLSGVAFANGTTVSADGTYTLVVTDAANNSTTLNFTIDKTPPAGSVIINNGAAYTNVANVTLAISSGDAVQMRFSNDNSGWTDWEATAATKLWVLPADGTKTIYLQLMDQIGNLSDSFRDVITYDPTVPTIALSSTATSPARISPVPMQVDFSEPVTGFTLEDIVVSGGTAANFSGSGSAYTFEVSPAGDGVITVAVAADKARDAAGNGNAAASPFLISFDATAPTAVIASTATSPTRISPVPVKVDFSEPVTGFTLEDIVVSGGTAANFSGSGNAYTFTVTPSGNGLITVNLGADKAQDAAGNGNAPASPFLISFDATAPTAVISSTATSPTRTSPVPVKVDFSEPVTGFTLEDIVVSGGTAANFSGSGNAYTFTVTPSGNGLITVNLAADKAQDAAGNGNAPALPFPITYDDTAPTAIIASTATSPTGTSPVPVQVDFSEPVTGFTLEDIVVSGGTAANFSGSGSTYNFEVSPAGDGVITVTVAADKARDAAGNGNASASPFLISFDATAPTAVIASTATSPTRISPVPVKVDFSEPVTGFTLEDIVVSGGTAANFSGSGSAYTFTVTPSGNGLITVNLAADKAQDAAGNGNAPALPFSMTYDDTPPTVALSSPTANPTNAAFVTTFTFAEAVSGFGPEAITVSNGSASAFRMISATTYSALITPVQDGTVTVDVSAGAARDAAGNGNPAATPFTVVYDGHGPAVAVTSTLTDPTHVSPIPVKVTFNENTSGFTLADIFVVGGAVQDFSGSGHDFTFNIIPAGDGVLTVEVPANAAQDAAGNGNGAAVPFRIHFDGSRPSVTLMAPPAEPANGAFTTTFTFSEPVTGFALDDITVSNGIASGFTALNATTYTALITPGTDGPVTVQVAANKAQDGAANGNTLSAPLSRQYDGTGPTVILTSTADSWVRAAYTVRFIFSEAVVGFDLQDILLTNGTASDLKVLSPTEYSVLITPLASGALSVALAAAQVSDAAGNGNLAATPLTRMVDNLAPAGYAIAFAQPTIDAINQTNVSLQVTAAEAGSAYFYTLSSDNGGTPLTGTATAAAALFEITGLDASGLRDGVLTASFYQQDAMGNTGVAATARIAKKSNDIVSVAPFGPMQVPFGTTFDQLPLPARAEATYTSGEKAMLDIDWQAGTYNGVAAGAYTLTGNLTLAPGTTNLNNRQATVTVEVQPNKEPTALTLSNATFSPDLEGIEGSRLMVDPIGLFSTADADDNNHTYALVSGEGSTDNDLFEILNNQLFLKSNSGLSGQEQFTIRVRTLDAHGNAFERAFILTKVHYAQTADNLKINNIFSPNGDGINDEWIIPELRFFNDVEIEVFDRSGTRVFHTTDPEKGWNGRGPSGVILDGSFLYVVQVKDNNLVKKGVVTILGN